MTQVMRLLISAYHMVNNLSTGLYKHSGQALMEIIRNGVVASMIDPKRWEPKRAKIEIFIDRDRMVVLDHGSGLTDEKLKRYFGHLGTSVRDLEAREAAGYNGASQKGIGRISPLRLTRKCMTGTDLERISHGFAIASRAAPSGKVRYVEVIPKDVEERQGFDTENFISASDVRLGPVAHTEGSFTAVLIPSPVFRGPGEIYEAIKWLLPREKQRMFTLLINGKSYDPPLLETQVTCTSDDGRYRAFIGRGKDVKSGGLWLCDSETGLRVARMRDLYGHMPDLLTTAELSGDIFAPGLLLLQDTSRSGLSEEFFEEGNVVCAELKQFLHMSVLPRVMALLSAGESSRNDRQALEDLASIFHDRYGIPFARRESSERGERGTSSGSKTSPKEFAKPTVEAHEGEGGLRIRVRDEIYRLRIMQMGPNEYAIFESPATIYLNRESNYVALPSTKAERREHCLMQILLAIGASCCDTTHEAIRHANELRAELLAEPADAKKVA